MTLTNKMSKKIKKENLGYGKFGIFLKKISIYILGGGIKLYKARGKNEQYLPRGQHITRISI